jgi:transposase InsO family protein
MTGIYVEHLRAHVIQPALRTLNLYSQDAQELLLGTAIHESACGKYLHQLGGPALGIFQVEPATHMDIWRNYLRYRHTLATRIDALASKGLRFTDGTPNDEQLAANLLYSAAIARIVYLRVTEPLPSAQDVDAMARYWKQHYNTPLGAGTPEQFSSSYRKYVVDS